jgi:UDP-glucuronate 4-epimerase
MNRILVTGAAGFIGFNLSKLLLDQNYKVYGIDNLNTYYDVNLKKNRLKILKKNKNFFFKKINIQNYKKVFNYIKKNKIKIIVHLAAQAGVRHSLNKPREYIDNNIIGFYNILEISRHLKIKNLLFASTSSVYGLNTKFPLREHRPADHPMQLYAATKKSNEVMAHAYSCLFKIPCTGLRFFTVYGPWGRPDMALFKFTKNILANRKIELFNYGKHARDFTYIDDVTNIISKLIKIPAKPNSLWNSDNPDSSSSSAPFRIYNVSNGNKITLRNFVREIEKILKKKSIIKYLPIQAGDIPETLSSKKKIKETIIIKAPTNYKLGIKNFIDWYKNYYKIKH